MAVPDAEAAPLVDFDPSAVHEALTTAENEFHQRFDGHVPDEVHRFGAFLSTVRSIVDQAADRAGKGE